MALFQKSVLNKYLNTLDDKKVKAAYHKYTAFFHDETIIQNIREDKEEQFQYGFLQKLFDEVLDYTINPNVDFNLTTELKNLKGSKKADGAILKDGKAVGVIELKGTKTKELSKITDQAFGYKNNHPTCVYIITSNFEKLRFYINDAVDYLDFHLFTLTEEQFKLLYLCLQKDSILSGLPERIKKESTLKEEDVTKKLYKDYSAFKNALFKDMVLKNPDIPKLTLFKKSQKLLDRFLFIFFAEDKGLLPPNSVSKIIKNFEALEDLDNYKPLYEVFQQYFNYINAGRPARKDKAEIFAFNGGLFAPDELLDRLKITDNILMNHTLLLSGYDFETEVDVNILGHIFEHSLNEIDEMTAELEGVTIDKNKTKRKKDGVFYTPKYITKYIVDNTVGKLCEEQKETIGIKEEEYKPRRTKPVKKRLLADLETYRAYLLSLTICDPACGSGAFLNQALDFLIKEHHYIDELQTKLLGGSIVFPDITNDILEKNIYGVDINEESVEIARLSLWLRTAKKGRALTTLNDNIKCGNSIVDDPEFAEGNAFVWEKEFPDIFKNGGFDVVIGNPPYVRQELLTPFKPYLKKSYKTYQGTADLFTYFIEISVDRLLNKDGIYSIIVANKWMRANYGNPLRKWMKEKRILEIIDFGDLPVFQDATAYPCILTISPKEPIETLWATEPKTLDFVDLEWYVQNNRFKVASESLADKGWALVNEKVNTLLNKLKNNGVALKKYTNDKFYRGVLTGLNEAFVIDKATRDRLIAESPKSAEVIKPFLAGRDVKRYTIHFQERYLIFTRRGIEIDVYPAIKNHLESYRERLEPKPKGWTDNWKGRKSGAYKWYEIQDSIDYYQEFEKPKIIYPNICKQPEFTWDEKNYYTNQKCFIISEASKFLLGILNSNVTFFYFKIVLPQLRGGFFEPGFTYMKDMPIPNSTPEVEKMIERNVDSNLSNEEKYNNLKTKLLRLVFRKFSIESVSTKMKDWDSLSFLEFTKELKKKKVKLSLSEEAEWEDYFETEKAKAQTIQSEIDKTDKEIDQMVYALYGLTEEEIAIVEGS